MDCASPRVSPLRRELVGEACVRATAAGRGRRGFAVLALVGLALAAHYPRAAYAGDGTETSGDVLRVAIPAAALALTFKRSDRPGRRDFFKALGTTVIGTLGLKAIVDKKRPDGSGDDAFPSGHAATAFQGAAFIHRRYGIGEAWPAYALATYVAWTRLDTDKHDEADVLAGAALGIASSFVFARRRERLSVNVFLRGDAVGIAVGGTF